MMMMMIVISYNKASFKVLVAKNFACITRTLNKLNSENSFNFTHSLLEGLNEYFITLSLAKSQVSKI